MCAEFGTKRSRIQVPPPRLSRAQITELIWALLIVARARVRTVGTTVPLAASGTAIELGSEVGGPRVGHCRPDDIDRQIRMQARETPGRADRLSVQLKA